MTEAQSELVRKFGPPALAMLILAIGLWTWNRTSQATHPSAAGLHLKCTVPECGAEFELDRDAMRDHPRGPNGEGLQCPRCDRFSARIAHRCGRCERWFVAAPDNPGARCPHCNPVSTRPSTRPGLAP